MNETAERYAFFKKLLSEVSDEQLKEIETFLSRSPKVEEVVAYLRQVIPNFNQKVMELQQS